MLMVPLATALTDRVDAKKVYLVGGLLATCGLLGMGILAYNFWTALILWRLMGLV
ncbi:hypothetical protein [Polynucleobacter necessarius]|uniref:hypothetical protein n=1 Tax=Polynucleobacter necessarius TaxID=576610 RepID=UPI0018D53754|nr:hypothetical protein [Polynucleobacter necessarius]